MVSAIPVPSEEDVMALVRNVLFGVVGALLGGAGAFWAEQTPPAEAVRTLQRPAVRATPPVEARLEWVGPEDLRLDYSTELIGSFSYTKSGREYEEALQEVLDDPDRDATSWVTRRPGAMWVLRGRYGRQSAPVGASSVWCRRDRGRPMLAPSIALLLLAAPAPEPPKLEPPVVKFRAATSRGGHARLIFEVTNPNRQPLPYVGYTADSFSPSLKAETIAPLYQVELRQGKAWKAKPMGWCGTGIGQVSLPARGKVTFEVLLPEGDWEAVRVGLTWFPSSDRKGAATAWSAGVSRKDATPKAP
jgi:hypothetical protein